MCKDFLAGPDEWIANEQEPHRFASIMTAEQMWEVVRFFEFHGICFEPESDESWDEFERSPEWQRIKAILPQISWLPHVSTS